MERPEELRFVTYLSPGIPSTFFEAVVDYVRRALGRRASLSVETRVSGPTSGGDDPFSKREADVGFLCSPSFFWLRALERPPVELLPVAPVFGDRRTPAQPVYFSEIVVRRESPARSFLDLCGSSWVYNDPCSLSGYYNVLKKLAEVDEDERFFGQVCCSGSHLESVGMVCRGEADAAAIDSNVLRIELKTSPELGEQLRVVESWGPLPIQPVVIRSDLHPELKEHLCSALLALDVNPHVSPTLTGFGLERFTPISYEHYAPEEQALRKCERLLSNRLSRSRS
jgi:phosphonate transport system substrate-binding protein